MSSLRPLLLTGALFVRIQTQQPAGVASVALPSVLDAGTLACRYPNMTANKGPVCVSVINMKGGVGKTTIAAMLCWRAARDGRKVLAVDLDPQANLSQALMGDRRYRQPNCAWSAGCR